VPGPASLVEASGDDGRFGVASGEIRGFSVFDRFLETGPQSTAGYELSYEGQAPARVQQGELTYELTWWEQSKAVPTMLDVTVAAPEGWEVAGATVEGGGTGQGFGPFGDGQELSAEVGSDGRARLTGTVSADATLQVRMVGSRGS
jgi:hypothetical protein